MLSIIYSASKYIWQMINKGNNKFVCIIIDVLLFYQAEIINHSGSFEVKLI